MGLFKDQCSVCNKQVGLLNRLMLNDLYWCCFNCLKLCRPVLGGDILKNNSPVLQNIYKYLLDCRGKFKDITITRRVDRFLGICEDAHKLVVFFGAEKAVFDYGDLVDFVVLEDGESVTTGGLGSAFAGGALFGGAGAVVGSVVGKRTTRGAVRSLVLKLIFKHRFIPSVNLTFLDVKYGKPISKRDYRFKKAFDKLQSCLTLLTIVGNSSTTVVPPNSGGVDDLTKLKSLLDSGVLTQEEFVAKKKQILGI